MPTKKRSRKKQLPYLDAHFSMVMSLNEKKKRACHGFVLFLHLYNSLLIVFFSFLCHHITFSYYKQDMQDESIRVISSVWAFWC